MTEINRTRCGDCLHVCKDDNGDIGLQFSRQAYFIDNATAIKLLNWLMMNVTLENELVSGAVTALNGESPLTTCVIASSLPLDE